ncbi:cytochrome P450 [Donghicola mangrovi]|uniref:Cytochrome P450 n=1 Tax=Donghicola mangrovi TaxID=2729614 RepID=A0A850Q1W1_9RHOB|nr:cytochrome P450 [Donghicola mangrovi]
MIPPKPAARADKVSLWRYMQLFRKDILSAQPQRLYRAWMAEFRTPFFRSYLVNQPELLDLVLKERPMDFPKSGRVNEGLRPLLGRSVFVTNGAEWQRQRRIIDPAFEGGRLRDTYPAMWAAAQAAVQRMERHVGQTIDVEPETSHVAADVIFRTLFTIPIEHEIASQVFHEFRAYQRSQPIVNLAAFIPMPKWMPRFFSRETKDSARLIRSLITRLTSDRMAAIHQGNAPGDLATKIMTTADPETGETFTTEEMVDQVAIFFLAGHETSASALAWTLYLMALYPEWQDRVASEAMALESGDFSEVSKLKISRDVFREALRLYPPVPMMVRETVQPECLRDRTAPKGSQIVLSPFHLHRHERLWDNPDAFDPERSKTEEGRTSARCAYMPFSAGPRVCTGAGFAMVEGVLILSMLLRHFRFEAIDSEVPIPVAHLTLRSANGIHLKITRR